MISNLAERTALVLSAAARKLFDVHGRIETKKHRARNTIPLNGDRIPLKIEGDNIAEVERRMVRLVDFIEWNALDTLLIIGSAYGRELVPLRERTSIHIVGADLSEAAVQACREYGLANTTFLVVNVETQAGLLWSKISGRRVGVYFCETAPYLLPERLQAFLSSMPQQAVAVMFYEPTHIDYTSRFDAGMPFSYRDNHWRHNYHRMLVTAGLPPYLSEFVMRRPGPVNQPMWLIAGSR